MNLKTRIESLERSKRYVQIPKIYFCAGSAPTESEQAEIDALSADTRVIVFSTADGRDHNKTTHEN